MKFNKKYLCITLMSIFLIYILVGCSPVILEKSPASTNTAISSDTADTNTDSTSYYFSKANQHPDEALINIINSSKETLNIAIYSLTKKEIVNAIINAKNRGVNVRLITDKEESSYKSEKPQLALLKKNGIPIKINSHSGLMHLKVTIADKSTTTTGSYNYTESATNKNDEVLVVIKGETTATTFENQFDNMWNDTVNFKEY